MTALAETMARLGKTQTDLARALGSRSRASEYLTGQRSLTLKAIEKLNAAWGVSADELLGLKHAPYSLTAHERVLDRIFADLRDRRFLKWLFSANPTLIGTFSDGEELRSLDADVQQEIRAAWSDIIRGNEAGGQS